MLKIFTSLLIVGYGNKEWEKCINTDIKISHSSCIKNNLSQYGRSSGIFVHCFKMSLNVVNCDKNREKKKMEVYD